MTAHASWMLVVDDDAMDSLALFRLLERQGHHATVADDAGAALDLLREEPYDLVVLHLPERDGGAFLEAMKSDESLCHVPVLVISDQ